MTIIIAMIIMASPPSFINAKGHFILKGLPCGYSPKMPVSQQAKFKLAVQIGTGSFRFKCPASVKVKESHGGSRNPLTSVFRSKGFVWLAHAPREIYYWAHSGPHLDLAAHSSWWADMPRSKWPKAEEGILQKF